MRYQDKKLVRQVEGLLHSLCLTLKEIEKNPFLAEEGWIEDLTEDLSPWMEYINEWQDEFPESYES